MPRMDPNCAGHFCFTESACGIRVSESRIQPFYRVELFVFSITCVLSKNRRNPTPTGFRQIIDNIESWRGVARKHIRKKTNPHPNRPTPSYTKRHARIAHEMRARRDT